MQPGVIIGLGTGRCGTRSLSRLLSSQPGMVVLHEGMLEGRSHPFRWEGDRDRVVAWIDGLPELLGRPAHCGDVGMYFLPYCEDLIASRPEVRFVCLERPRAAVVESFLRHLPDRHPWLRHDGRRWRIDPVWDAAYPTFDEPDKARAVGLYWDLYKTEVDRLVALHPTRVGRFSTEALNSVEGRNAILDFVGYGGERRVQGPFHANARPGPVRRAARMGLERTIAVCRPLLPATVRRFLWEHVLHHVHVRFRSPD